MIERRPVAQILHEILGTAGLCCSQVIMDGVKLNPDKTVSITYFPGVTSDDVTYLQASKRDPKLMQCQRQALWSILHTAGIHDGRVSGKHPDTILKLVEVGSEVEGDPLASPYQLVTGTYQLQEA